ncbi:MAG: hypothetical protein KA173_07205, partial [Rhodoferax sp.]|nr:hypothetical protein [Rhodoferax sp.]
QNRGKVRRHALPLLIGQGMALLCHWKSSKVGLHLNMTSITGPNTDALIHFIHANLMPHGESHKVQKVHHGEHVVPRSLLREKATELLRHGIPEWVVAEWIEPYLQIVHIEKTDAKQLDGPLKLQTVMPKDWQFGRDCIYARLHVLSIEFTPPLEGPKCTCTPENLRDWALLRNVAKPST